MEYLKQILKFKKDNLKDLDKYLEEKEMHIKLKRDAIFRKNETANTGNSCPNIDIDFGFINNINNKRLNIIAEIKKASPSAGILNSGLDVGKTAEIYDRYKSFISAISVLTEPLYFKGDAKSISIVKKATSLPVLRKDFIFNQKQVYESAVLGADCILLISSILGFKKLKKLYTEAKNLGLDVLIEAHTKKEFLKALDTGTKLIGINNRNLKNMKTDASNVLDIMANVPESEFKDRIIVSESGIGSVDDIKLIYSKGIRVFLIGSFFMQSGNLPNQLSIMEKIFIKEKLI